MIASNLRNIGLVVGAFGVAALPCGLNARSLGMNPPAPPSVSSSKPNLCDQAMRMLQEGNQRFIEGKSTHPNTDVFRVGETGEHGQHPFASIVTCADSRLAVERLFDRGVGDLFVVRVAGAIADANQTGSIEYACEHLDTQLVVVMGHTKCGAVKAAIGGGDAGKNIGSLLDNITPAVQATRAKHPELTGDAMVDAVVRENVWETIEDMFKGSPMLRDKVASDQVRIVGAVYNVETGRVEWLGSHPAQAGLLKTNEQSETASAEPGAQADNKLIDKPAASKPSPTSEKPTPTAAKPSTPSKPSPVTAKPSEPEPHAPAHATAPH